MTIDLFTSQSIHPCIQALLGAVPMSPSCPACAPSPSSACAFSAPLSSQHLHVFLANYPSLFLNLFTLSSPYCSPSLFYLPLFLSICCIIFSRLCPLHPVSSLLSHSFSSKSFLSIIFLLYVLFPFHALFFSIAIFCLACSLWIFALSRPCQELYLYSLLFLPPLRSPPLCISLFYISLMDRLTQEKCVFTHTQSMHGISFTFHMHTYFTQAVKVHMNIL